MPEPEPVDRDRYEAGMAWLHEILADISETATEVSRWRCPYKSVKDRCTASFGCRNQDHAAPEGERAVCTGSDKLDYRAAWEV